MEAERGRGMEDSCDSSSGIGVEGARGDTDERVGCGEDDINILVLVFLMMNA